MSTTDSEPRTHHSAPRTARAVRALAATTVLAALAAGCTGRDSSPPPEPGRSTLPTSPSPTVAHGAPGRRGTSERSSRASTLERFLAKVRRLERGRVGPDFSLVDVHYTSPTDAAAAFDSCARRRRRGCATVIATTDANWDRAAGIVIPESVADLVDYIPLGHGAVAIKAKSQLIPRSYPPFILFPNGRARLLDVAERQPLDAGSEILPSHLGGFFYAIGAGTPRVWAVDLAAGEIHSVEGSPIGMDLWGSWEHVAVREDEVVTTVGYRRRHDGGVWRTRESTDAGRAWRQVDVRLPLGPKPLWRYAGTSLHVVGKGDQQAIAMSEAPPDLPLYLWELWRAADEGTFRRVPLPSDSMPFAGMAFAADGSLLVAEIEEPVTTCQISKRSCQRSGRIWRLPPGESRMRLLHGAPRLSGPHGLTGLHVGGGMMVVRTGYQTVAVSQDGFEWTSVVPGR